MLVVTLIIIDVTLITLFRIDGLALQALMSLELL